MKIVIAPDSFKGSLTSQEAADTIAKSFLKIFPQAEIEKIPLSDGGEGTTQILINATKGKIYSEFVTSPIGEKINTNYGILGDRKTAVIEMAAASGLSLVPIEKRNPLFTTTFGTGELIKAALNKGCRKFIIGMGDSATTDAGAGLAQALGVKLLTEENQEIPLGGIGLKKLQRIDISNIDKRILESEITVACDVNNPLTGPSGTASVYSVQKGASKDDVKKLELYLINFAEVVKRDLGKEIQSVPHSGAAGGLAAGLLAFFDAQLKSGFEVVSNILNFPERIKDADLVITGEGKIDAQTLKGKTPIEVAKIAGENNIPVIAIAGIIGDGADKCLKAGIEAIFSLTSKKTGTEKTLEKAKLLLAGVSEDIAKKFKKGMLFGVDVTQSILIVKK
ncbi:MAG: glycerate kinase [Armatimonadetes bacterium]|nr:glycerate kinase [Armatimonadota bacterium]